MRATAVLVGVGLVGSYLIPLMARLKGLRQLTLIDPDSFSESNLQCQDIELRDVGRRKAVVQARRARRIAPDLEVNALSVPVESVPAGVLRAGLVVTATDSLRSRRAVADRIWPLGVPWVDAGVHGPERLVRVTSYLPGEGRPCIECSWDTRHYDAADRVRSCLEASRAGDNGGAGWAPPTNATAGLGAIAAALEAQVCEELWNSEMPPDKFGTEVIFDLARHHAYACTLRRSSECRRPRHEPWEIETLELSPSRIRLEEILALAPPQSGAGGAYLQVLGSAFAGRLVCSSGCGREKRLLRLEASLGRAARKCPGCGGSMGIVGFNSRDRLSEDDLRPQALRRNLRGLGLRSGDVVTVGRRRSDRQRHFELNGKAV